MTKISVIVPIYNDEKYISRCIDSVLCQSYSDFELLLINDGSSDNSANICDEYAKKDCRIKVIHKENGGVSFARNCGINNSKGDWIIFIDSDDYFLNDALSILLTNAIENSTLISCANFYTEMNKLRKAVCVGNKSKIIKNNFKSWYFLYSFPRAGAALFNKSILINNLFDEKLSRYEDAKFLFDLLRQNKMYYSNKFVMVYSLDNNGLSTKAKEYNADFVFNMHFDNKPFWEKIILASYINSALKLYNEHSLIIKNKYSRFLIYCLFERFLSIINRIYIKLNKQYDNKLYKINN